MARKFLTAVDLGKNELQNASVQNLGSAPSSPVKGQLYFNTGDNTLYWWDGSQWASARGGGTGFPGFGTITASTTFGQAKNDGVGTTTARNDHVHGTPAHDAAAHSGIKISDLSSPTTAVSFGGQKITTLGTPTAGTDATTKDYVDNMQAGLSWKEAVRAASVSNGTLASAFQNGATIDSVVLATGNRILIKAQTTTTENGIYTVNASGAPTRATDADAVGELEQATVFVQEGASCGDTAWTCTTNGAITPGTTGTAWAQFGAGTSYAAGNGLTLIGSTFHVAPLNSSIQVAVGSIEVGFGGSGGAWGTQTYAARSDHNHDTTYTKKFTQATIGGATSQVVTHNLNTQACIVNVYRTLTPWDTVECDVERTTVNTVTLRFSVAPSANEYSVVVVG